MAIKITEVINGRTQPRVVEDSDMSKPELKNRKIERIKRILRNMHKMRQQIRNSDSPIKTVEMEKLYDMALFNIEKIVEEDILKPVLMPGQNINEVIMRDLLQRRA